MNNSTYPFQNRIALVFDFDETLAPSTFSRLLQHLDLDPEQFKRERVQPLTDNEWEDVLAKGYCLINESQRREQPINRETFRQVAEKLPLYNGVPEMFGRLRKCAQEILPDIEVEFYLLTAGFIEIPQATAIADEFTEMWGGTFHTDEEGAILSVKRVITHSEKVRYLLMLAKGLARTGGSEPADVYRRVPDSEMHVPIDQMIYVGDGASDTPAFSLMNSHGGMALGVFQADKAEEWDGHSDVRRDQRVQNLAPSDYAEGSELMRSLMLAVQSVCKRIALRKLSIGE